MPSSRAPDYKGIEIKSSRGSAAGRSKNRGNLFSKTPDWKTSELKSGGEILDEYGYLSAKTGRQQLYCTVSTNPNPQTLYFDLPEESAYLENCSRRPTGDSRPVVHWHWDTLESALVQKHRETFWVEATASSLEGQIEFFQYSSVTHTRMPLVSNFKTLVGMGKITMDYTLSRRETGRIRDHGYLFKIHPDDLGLLFPAPRRFDLVADR